DATLDVGASGVLGNDTDVFPLVAVQAAGAAHGTVTLNADGSFHYAPAANFNGSDTFSYKAKDTSGNESAVVTVTITIASVNDAPAFVKGPDQAPAEDAGSVSVSWATAIGAGPADESGQ